VKLGHLAKWNLQRRDHAAEYSRLLIDANCGINPPYEPSWTKPVYHLYVVRVADRERTMEHLKQAGIGTGIHYPIPLHLQKAYSSLNYRFEDFPVTEKLSSAIISLPMYPHLGREQQELVVKNMLSFIAPEQRNENSVSSNAGAPLAV
jgi:dTDP-4-amino-4,6-dideoxygalactose transaminase